MPPRAFASIAQRMQSATEAKEPAWDEVLWAPPETVNPPAASPEPVALAASAFKIEAEPDQAASVEVAAFAQRDDEPLQTEALETPAIEVQAEQPAAQEVPDAAVVDEPDTDTAQPEEAAPLQPMPALAAEFAPHDGDAEHEHVPDFVKQAQRKAWWSQPVVRFAMGMLVIFLPMTLLLQVAIHERNTLAAWKPQWRPALETLCVALRCELAPRKHIASVVLTGSSFTHEARANHYRLDVSIQNQSSLAVATPAVELTLTDSQDQVLVRKVLDLSEIGAPPELAAHGEWNGTLPVMTQGLHLPVSGYRVMAFYP